MDTMDTPMQDLAVAQQLIDRHFDIWNHADKAARMALFPSVYTEDIFVADYAGAVTGFQQVNELIARVQAGHAGFRFTPDPVAWNHGLGRVTWGYGPAENPHQVRGEDIFAVRGGRLSSLRVFLDKK